MAVRAGRRDLDPIATVLNFPPGTGRMNSSILSHYITAGRCCRGSTRRWRGARGGAGWTPSAPC